MTLENRRKDVRLRRQLETDYKLERDVVSPYRRYNGVLRGMVEAVTMAVEHNDMSWENGYAELLILGLSPEAIGRLLGSNND